MAFVRIEASRAACYRVAPFLTAARAVAPVDRRSRPCFFSRTGGCGRQRSRSRTIVAIGRLAFRYRGTLFPVILLLVLLISKPGDFLGRPELDPWLDAVGLLVVLMGLAVRAVTIGFQYIVRGGRKKQVYADKLVQGGIYAHTRNPMYLGNGLITLGCALVINAPQFYLIALPLTFFLYAAIIAAEEAFLRGKFGAEFDEYCARVNRVLPSLSGFRRSVEGMRFNWRRVLVKDYTTIFMSIVGVVALDWWEHGVNQALVPWTPPQLLIVWLLLFALVWYLKKSRRLEGGEQQEASAA